ncbi:MAG: trigger factor [Alphaproteobacteria bacterium]|nr:trigger factor [Alphaproteobacteria bacterium]
MQINEKKVDGLKHTFEVVVPSETVESEISLRLQEAGKSIKLPGFRPGKVPLAILIKRYEPGIRRETLEKTIHQSTQKILKEKQLSPASDPQYDIKEYEAGQDLNFSMEIEVLPKIVPADLTKVPFERLKVKVTESDINEALEKIAKDHHRTRSVEKARKAKKHDTLIIDFKGWQGKTLIPGGESENFRLQLGSGSLVPGFEDQLIGANVGDKVEVNIVFPETYPEKSLAGKKARFEVTVKEHHESVSVGIDDELAKDYNFSDLKAMREEIKKKLTIQFEHSAFLLIKRSVLDILAEKHTFQVPEVMVNNEFELIWKQAQEEFEAEVTEGSKPKTSKELESRKKMFKAIAERRVRLGLLLAEIGQQNKISVSQAELQKALREEVTKYGAQAQEAFNYYLKNKQAQAQIHAPLYENKVIEFILKNSNLSECEITTKEFNKKLEQLEKSIN